jgi:hypothetical protein
LELMAHDVTGRVQLAGPRPSLRHTVLGIPFCVTFVFPALAGSTESYDLLKLAGASMGSFTCYIGIVPFTMFLIGATNVRERRVRAWLIVMALVVGIVFFTPLVKYVYHRFFVVAAFGATVIAALGTDFALEESRLHPERVRRVFTWMTAACVALGLGLILTQIVVHAWRGTLLEAGQRYLTQHAEKTAFANNQNWLRDRVPLFLDHFRLSNVVFWLPICAVVGCAACWIRFAEGRVSRAAFCAAMVVLTVCDLTVLGRKTVPQIDLKKYPVYPALPVLAEIQQDPDLFRVYQWSPRQPVFLPNNMLMVYGLSTLAGYESLAPANLNSLPTRTHDRFNALLDLANVKYLLTDRTTDLPSDHFELVADSGDARLYRNRGCLRRLQFYGQWQVVPERERMLQLMNTDAFNPQETVLLEETPPPASVSSNAAAMVSLERYTGCRVVAKVNAAHGGVLLLADTYYPGWKVRVDDRSAPLYRADYVLRAAFVPAGSHVVEFYYAPLSFRIGAAISLLTIALSAMSWALYRRQRRSVMPH